LLRIQRYLLRPRMNEALGRECQGNRHKEKPSSTVSQSSAALQAVSRDREKSSDPVSDGG
jgi:hypothetical protein